MNEPLPIPAGISPADQAKLMGRRDEIEAKRAAKRRELAIALQRILGVEGKRTGDQAAVWEYLTRDAWSVARSTETNDLLVFEGQRRKAVEIVVLVDEANQ